MQYMIPIDSINAILIAEYFVRYIFKLHRLPNSIISNYRNQYILNSNKPYANN